MGHFKIGNFSFGWGGGKNAYTNTPFTRLSSQLFGTKGEQWVTVDNQEAHLFNTTPQLFTVIGTKAQMYSNGVFKHYRIKDDKKEELIDTEVLERLNNPNPLQSRSEWMMEELIYNSIYGNSFTYGLRGFSTQQIPSVLWNLPPAFIKVDVTGKIYKQSDLKDIIKSYDLCIPGEDKQPFDPTDVIHSKVFNPKNPLIGLSPLEALKMPISNIREAYGLRNVLLAEKGMIGILSNEKKNDQGMIPVTPAEKKEVDLQLTKDFGTKDGQRRYSITNAALKWQPMVFPIKDMMTFEEISEDTRSIIDAYNLNEHLFGKDKGTTFANLKDGKKIAYQDGVIPYAENQAEKLTDFFGLRDKNEVIEIDYSHIEALQENEKEKAETGKLKAEAISKLKADGFSNEEINRILGIDTLTK